MGGVSSSAGAYRVREGRGSSGWRRGEYWQLGGDRDLSNLCLGLYVSCLLPRSAVGLEFVSYGLENSKGGYRKTELIEIGEELKYLALGGRFICSLRSSTTSRNSAVLASRFL